MRNYRDFPGLGRVTQILISTVCTLLLLYWGKLLLIPLFLAFLFAVFLYPATKFFERKHFGKMVAAAASALLFFLFVCIVGYFFSAQLSQFVKALPDIKEKLDVLVQNVQSWISSTYHINGHSQAGYLNSSINNFFSFTGDAIGGIMEGLILFALVLFFTFYILYHRKLLEGFITSLFGQVHKKKIVEIISEARSLIKGYVKGLILEMCIVIAMAFIGLFSLGLKYALLMAVFAGVLNLVPYLGIYAAAAINALIILATAGSTKAIEVVCLFIIIHVVDANIILPRVVGGSVKMNPFVTLIAVVIGNLIWGIPGMFLFIPLTAIFRVLSEKIKDFRAWAILIGEEEKKNT